MVANLYFLPRPIITVLCFLTALAFSSFSIADQVTAALDKSIISESEAVQLTIRTDFANTANGPDLSPLKRDFEIVSRTQNSQFSFNLGTNQALNFWVVTLMPKAVGNFQIPPIKVGELQSEPLYLEVKPAKQMTDKLGNPLVMLKFKSDITEPYVQQQVLVTLELYTAVPLQSANLTTPNHPSLLLERLSDDQMRYEEINGTSYQVLTREYVAFPQLSGPIELVNQSVEAMVNTHTGIHKVSIKSTPISLNVLSIPASYGNSNWLPTNAVTARSVLSNGASNPRIGDTLFWDIDITAQGVLGEQLPVISYPSNRAYKLYPASPNYETNKNINGVTGHASMRIEVVPTQSGPLKLPDVQVTYWDPITRQTKVATASAAVVDVAPLPNNSSTNQSDPTNPITDSESTLKQEIPPQSTSVAPISLAKSKQPNSTQEKSIESPEPVEVIITTPNNSSPHWMAIAAGIIMLIGGIGLGLWIILKRRSSFVADAASSVPTLQEFAPLSSGNEEAAYQQLIKGCRHSDLNTLRLNLLEWARHRWGDDAIRSVDDIKRLTDTPHLTQLLMEAELVMYSSSASSYWNGDALADALEEYVTGQTKPSQASQLKTLYPNF
ncbi:BatD family protein [Marinomonas ostreistagni]|uniref:BatD family protein n=1 Tax=Marinomonas ostreistagni TaxID=359209 RepID=A0ABS0ZB78_9GAMM|nr:BatD family protein [Marinomonas ostreistagni]MBJ7550478.1 BatD family protein [Marinomonas ostreistagni]